MLAGLCAAVSQLVVLGGDMQRYKLNLQGGTYNEANAYQAVPIYRQQVVPGQTADIQAQVNIKTAAFTKNLTTPALCSVWFLVNAAVFILTCA